MDGNRKVVFRRINGRIVPIKPKRENRLRAQGLGLSGAGGGIAVLGGILSGRQIKRAREGVQLSFNLGRTGMEGASAGAHIFKGAQKRFKVGKSGITASKIAAGLLLGEGFERIVRGEGKSDINSALISGAASQAAAFGVHAGVEKIVSEKGLLKSAREGAAKVAKFAIRRKFKF